MDSLGQDFVLGYPSTIPLRHFRRGQVAEVARRLSDINPTVIGLSIRLSPEGYVDYVALATSEEIMLLKLEIGGNNLSSPPVTMRSIFGGSRCILVAFEMAQVALLIHRGLQQNVQGIDLSTLLARKPLSPSEYVSKKQLPPCRKPIDQLWAGDPEPGFREVCLRAWLSAYVAECSIPEITVALKVNTRNLKPDELEVLGKMTLEAVTLRSEKPKEIENEFSSVDETGTGELFLRNSRYKNRARPSFQTSIVMTNADGDEFVGRAASAIGKTTTIQLQTGKLSGTVERVRIVGREEPTGSERARDEFILLVLRGERTLDEPFIHFLWFPLPEDLPRPIPARGIMKYPSIERLNESQREVVRAMLSDQMPLVIAHGPPGTGKTSTISAAIKIWDNMKVSVWIVAQSNVAVKNIAESLLQRDVDFILIVSREFYVEWHEHIYEKIQHNLLRSDEFPEDFGEMERAIGGSTIVLCTLSMLSNPVLTERGLYKIIPVERLVIDEASQIDVGEFMHLFSAFKKLQKLCFFGDPKQLPPYGKDTVQSLQSVFEIKHLKKQAHFLNTQYRMPVPLGAFISENVYDKKLRSEHKIHDMECVVFVDVTKGHEEKSGNSWRNQDEVHTIVHLVRNYYRVKDFCIITPYDAQRAALERQLKTENLPWERVFNVDSFQGNEAEYVILSVVRTTSPGFLTSRNRSNVMLTRCKTGMVIVTNRTFLRRTGAQYTLLGELAQHWARSHGESKTWRDWKDVAEQKADLPGVLGAHRPKTSPVAIPSKITRPPAKAPPAQSPTPAVSPESLLPALARMEVRAAPVKNEFPNLVTSKSSKTTIQGRWGSPAGVSAVKRFTPRTPDEATLQTPPPTQNQRQPGVRPLRDFLSGSLDQFPSLSSHQGKKKPQTRGTN